MVKEGKSPEEDDIMTELLKPCDIDDILLHFGNKLLINGEKPEPHNLQLKTNSKIR